MSEITIGDKFGLKDTSFVYIVYDITGAAKSTPNLDGKVVWMRLSNRLGLFEKADRFISVPERKFWDFFTEDFAR